MYSRTCTMDIIMQQRSQFLLPYCYLAFFLFAVKTSRMTIKSTVIVFIVGFLCYSLLNMMRVVVLFFFVACSREGENYWIHSIEWFCNTYFGRLACTFCRECLVELPLKFKQRLSRLECTVKLLMPSVKVFILFLLSFVVLGSWQCNLYFRWQLWWSSWSFQVLLFHFVLLLLHNKLYSGFCWSLINEVLFISFCVCFFHLLQCYIAHGIYVCSSKYWFFIIR